MKIIVSLIFEWKKKKGTMVIKLSKKVRQPPVKSDVALKRKKEQVNSDMLLI